jgi:hypothetical protein
MTSRELSQHGVEQTARLEPEFEDLCLPEKIFLAQFSNHPLVTPAVIN